MVVFRARSRSGKMKVDDPEDRQSLRHIEPEEPLHPRPASQRVRRVGRKKLVQARDFTGVRPDDRQL